MWEKDKVLRRLRMHANIADSRARMAERAGHATHAEAWRASATAMRTEMKRLEAVDLSGTTTTEMGPVGKALSGATTFGIFGAFAGAVLPGTTAARGAKLGLGIGAVLGLLGLGAGSITRTRRLTTRD